jgi:hypothetical protein
MSFAIPEGFIISWDAFPSYVHSSFFVVVISNELIQSFEFFFFILCLCGVFVFLRGDLPPILTRNGVSYDRMAAPTAFSEYFKSKISVIEESMTINEDMRNGEKIINSESINFMTPERVEDYLKKFKSKN